MDIKVKPKEATAIINSLISGVVPKIGVQHITVGRSNEVDMIIQALEEVKNGHSMMKCWIGDFGSGKSFMMHLLNTVALKKKFITTTADFAPHIRLYSNDGKAQALYASLMDNIAIQTKPEGGALHILLEKWIEQVITQTASDNNIALTEIRSPQYVRLIQDGIMQTVDAITETGGFDFGLALTKYYEGFITGKDMLRKNALRWLKGEYTTKTEARRELGTSEIVNDRNYYDMLKNFCHLFVSIGYSGFVINLDEAINLYRIANTGMRQKNYETLLSMYNDCFQGKIEHLFINIAGTTQVLEDRQKGLYSYDALKTRLKVNKFETIQLRDYAQPVIRLMPLSHDEIFVLLYNLRDIFHFNYQTETDFTDQDVHRFMEEMYNKPGASEFLTPREVIRDFLNILNILRQNPGADKNKLIDDVQIVDERESAFEPEETARRTKTERAGKQVAEELPDDDTFTDDEDMLLERETLAGELNYWRNEIQHETIKARLVRMSKIAHLIYEKDHASGEVFSLRHTDTVIKLLDEYSSLEKSGLDSPEALAWRERIAGTIELTYQAFEQELSKLFEADMLDIDAESMAYTQNLKNRGLIN
ncbi:MAG: ATP-binding protein [Tannerellaceae bacterium]|jgi:hypothetical protein|nr:ATP-binding protein [Tannerellaceae bacterium]